MPTEKLRRLSYAAVILVYIAALALVFFGCAHGALAAQPATVVVASTPWYGEPATVWDFLKWLMAGFTAIVGWAIRVEMRLARHGGKIEAQGATICKHDEIIATNAKLIEKHENLLEAHIKTLDHIERTLADWTNVKEERAERLMRIETRLDRLDKIEVKLDYVIQSRQDRYAPPPAQELQR